MRKLLQQMLERTRPPGSGGRLLLTAFALSIYSVAFAQTTLVQIGAGGPTSSGGFENAAPTGTPATDFTANNWTVANSGLANNWYIGTAGSPAAGSYHAFVGPDGSTWLGTNTASWSHLSRDITIPPGESILTISYRYKITVVDATFDFVTVRVGPTTAAPTAGSAWTPIGATLLQQQDGTTSYANYSTSTSVTPGTTVRVVFSFRNDGFNPAGAAALDDIQVQSSVPSTFTATAQGGLWNSPGTWVGGVVPGSGNDIVIPAGSTVMANQANTYRNLSVSGNLLWNGTFAQTFTGNVTVNSGGFIHTLSTAASGQTINIAGDMVNNGTINAVFGTLNFNGTGNSQLSGTGNFVTSGSRGIIRNLYAQNSGTFTLNQSQDITVSSLLVNTCNNFVTNGKIRVDNANDYFSNDVLVMGITAMGSGYATAPNLAVNGAQAWVAGPTALNSVRINAGHQYVSLDAVSSSTAPTHTSNNVVNPGDGKLWLHIGPVGTIGTALGSAFGAAANTQYVYNNRIYTCVTAGTMTAAQIQAAMPISTTVGTAVTIGTNVFRCVGTAVSATLNHDAVNSVVRSVTIVSAGTGVSSTQNSAIVGGGGTGATLTAIYTTGMVGPATATATKATASVFTGAVDTRHSTVPAGAAGNGVYSATPGVSQRGWYNTVPSVGFSAPLIANLVTAQGSGYVTTAPTVSVAGGTLISGSVMAPGDFQVNVAGGRVVSVYYNGATTKIYSVPPTISLTGGSGAGATISWGTSWPSASVTLSGGTSGQVTGITITNNGYGYATAPTMAFSATVVGEAAATTPTCRLQQLDLRWGFFTPQTTNPNNNSVMAMVPSNNRINGFVVTSGAQTFTASIEATAAAPLSTFTGVIDMGGSNRLTFSHPDYVGTAGAVDANVANGSVELSLRGGNTGSATRTFPIGGGSGNTSHFIHTTGAGTASTGFTYSSVEVQRFTSPTGGVATGGNLTGVRGVRMDLKGVGSLVNLNTTGRLVQMFYNVLDNLVSDNASLFLAESASPGGSWSRISVAGSAGALPSTGNRQSQGVTPFYTANATMYYAWVNNGFVVPTVGIDYNVVRTSSATYTSIAPANKGGNGSGIALTGWTGSSNDEEQATITLPSWAGTFQGSPVTGVRVHTNGFLQIINGPINFPTSPATNNMSLNTVPNVVAAFWEDLVNKQTGVNNRDNSIQYAITGTSPNRVLTVEWSDMGVFGATDAASLNFQIQLLEDGKIRINYGDNVLFNGTTERRYSYSVGIKGGYNSNYPTAGQVFAQQYENYNLFAANRTQSANLGANGLASSPEPRSRFEFTPGGGYSPPPIPGATPPSNDSPGSPESMTALSAFPPTVQGLAWNEPDNKPRIYTTRFATSTGSPPAASCGPAGASDVWFRFQAKPNETDVTVRIYPSGGYIPRIVVYSDDLSSVINCSVGAKGAVTDALLTGLTAGNFYMVRVSHDRVGTTATFAGTSVSGGAVGGLSIISGGSGYTTSPATFGGPTGTRMSATGGGGNSFVGAVTNVASESVSGGNFDGGNDYTSLPNIAIESPNWGVTGDFAIVIYAPPINDNSSGAIALTSVSTGTCTPGFNQRLNVSGSSATPSTESLGSCALGVDDDLWYKFVASGSNSVITVLGSAGYDAAMQIWDAGSAGLSTSKILVTTPANGCVNATGAGATETVTLTTTPGNTYFIRVYHAGIGFGGAGANFSICVITPVPACATPNTPLASSTTCATPTTVLDWQSVQYATGYDVFLDPGAGAPTTQVASNQATSTFNAGVLAAGQYTYRIVPRNGNGAATGCSNITFTVLSPVPTANTPGTRCGVGTVTLAATAAVGQTLRWYAAATGGTPLATGASYTTPAISTTTSYYVSAGNPITDNISLGTGSGIPTSTSGITPYSCLFFFQRTQYLVRASELLNAGLIAGNINQLSFTVTAAVGSMSSYSIKLAGTNATALSSAFLNETFTTVFSTASYTPVLGLNTHVFTTPYNWNGVDNLVVEICSNNNPFTSSSTVATTAVGYQAAYGQFVDGTSSICGGTPTSPGSNSSTSRPDMVFRGQALCSGPRVEVVATVTPPPALVLSSPTAVVCEGGTSTVVSINSSLANFATYTWSPATGVSGTPATGYTFNPSGSTAYVLTATGSGASPCVNQALFSALVRPVPSPGTASLSGSAPYCEGTSVNLTVSGLVLPSTILSQNWETGLGTWTQVNNSTHPSGPVAAAVPAFSIYSHTATLGSGTFAQTINSPGGNSFIASDADAAGSGLTLQANLISPVFNLDGYSAAQLTFRHYFRAGTSARVEISTNGGLTYNTVTPLASYTTTQGSNSVFASVTISLSSFVGQSNCRLRFVHSGGWDFYWCIDDIAVTGTPPTVNYVWTGPNSFVSSGQNTSVSDLLLANNGVYTVTATTTQGCSASASTPALTVTARPTVKFVGNDFVCQGQTAPVDIEFTGVQPWDLVYTINGAPTNLFNQTSSPVAISYFNATTTRTYAATSLTDASGCLVDNLSGLGSLQIVVPLPNCFVTWDGSQGNGSWTDAENWTPNNSAPSQQTSVIIPNLASLPVIGTSVTGNCADLTLNASSNVTVNTGGTLNIRGSVNSSNAVVSGLGNVGFTGAGVQTITGQLTLNNVNFSNTNGGVSLAPGARLVVNPTASTGSGIVTFAAGSKLTGTGTLVLASNATATAKIGFVPSTPVVTISAPVEVQRWLPWVSGEGAWYFMGSPITGKNFSDIADDFTVYGMFDGMGTQSGVVPVHNVERVSVFKHQENQHGIKLDTVQKRGWRLVGNENILPGVGYRTYLKFYTNPSHRVDHVGQVVTGNFTFPTLTRTHVNPCAPSAVGFSAEVCDEAVRGYNLVANPYPCDIDWATTAPNAINKTGLINGFATWNAVQGGYRYFDGGSGTPLGTTISGNPNPSVIASSQAFWVRVANQGSVNTFSITESAKTTTVPATYTRVASVLSNNLRIKVSNLADNDGYDYTAAVWFSDNGTDGFDSELDMPSMSSSRVYLGFNVGDEFMVRSALSSLTEYRVVPMVVKYQGQSGNFRFSFDDLSSFEATTEIYLRDNYLGTLHNVAAGDYNFYAGSITGSNASDRFELVFSPNSVTGSAGLVNGAAMVVMPNPGDQRSASSVEISGIEAASGNFDVTDALGRVLFTSAVLLDKGSARLQVPADLAAGVYTLKFVGGNKQIQKKFVVR